MNGLSFQTLIHLVTILLIGLSGGLFFAWQVSVIPGTLRITEASYLETMKSINKEILNPYFFIVFFGALVFVLADTGLHLSHERNLTSLWVLLAGMFYAVTFGITAFGNVPLNNALEALNLDGMSPDELKNFRINYEVSWNKYHLYRTWSSVLAFLFIILATINSK